MRPVGLLLACPILALLALPQTARADAMEVSTTILPDLTFFGVNGLPASFTRGQLSLRLAATGTAPHSSSGSGFGAVPGPALLLGGYLTARETYLYPPTGMAIQGTRFEIRLDFLPAAGLLSAASGDLRLPLVRVEGTSMQTCSGYDHCVPGETGIPQTQTFSHSFPLTVAGLLGTTLDPSAWVGLSLPMSPGMIVAMRITYAAEISRHFLPEPEGGVGLTTGAALLVALVARRRRREVLPSRRCGARSLCSRRQASP